MNVPYRTVSTLAALSLSLSAAGARAVDAPGTPSPPDNARKNRYISFVPNNPGVNIAFRVDLTGSTLFPGSIGLAGWVGVPFDPGCPDPGDPIDACSGEYIARLECAPVFHVWDEAFIVHVGDANIVPTSTYELRAIDESGVVSDALVVATAPKPDGRQWADLAGAPAQEGDPWKGPDGFVNVTDLQAGILTLQGTVNTAPVLWVDLVPGTPNHFINVEDIQGILQGIAGWAYPFTEPSEYLFPWLPGCSDCNNNGDCDACEIGLEKRPDCNQNGIPDECDIGAGGGSFDCNVNGIPDECEPDCNGNGIPDDCDIAQSDGGLCIGTVGVDCSGDCNGNGAPDECDIAVHTAGDCNGNGIPDSCEIANNAALDPDGDRLLTECETGTGVYISEADAGTKPDDADSDGDGIGDGDEVLGTAQGLYLPALGADPNHRSIFVEIDWFDDATQVPHSHRPTAAAIQMVVDAFAAAPLLNPDGATGIDLIVDFGQGGVFTGGNLIPGSVTIVSWPGDFSSYKAAHFATNRLGYFRYGIQAHFLSVPGSGIAELPGDDFMVTLGNDLDDSGVSKTLMHELGHNLSLHHGGFEERNYKPNYNSVMNYRFQFLGIDSDCDSFGEGLLDYSHGLNGPLDENNLDENLGVCGAGFPIDWDLDTILTVGLARNINCVEGASAPCGVDPGPGVCYDLACEALEDSDDWAQVQLPITAANRAAQEVVTCENMPPSNPVGSEVAR